MRKYLTVILLFSLSITLCGCGKDNNNDDELMSKAEYYVKYEASVSSIHVGNIKYTVRTENGLQIFNTGEIVFTNFRTF